MWDRQLISVGCHSIIFGIYDEVSYHCKTGIFNRRNVKANCVTGEARQNNPFKEWLDL